MRKTTTIFVMMFSMVTAFGQYIPDGGYEGPIFKGGTVNGGGINKHCATYSGTGGYTVDYEPLDTSVFVDTIGHGDWCGVVWPCQSNSDTLDERTNPYIGKKFASTLRPDFLKFSYMFFPRPYSTSENYKEELAGAIIKFTKYNTTTMKNEVVLNDTFFVRGFVCPWKDTLIDLRTKYKLSINPDTISILFYARLTDSTSNDTEFYNDNLEFTFATSSVEAIHKNIFENMSVSPNPVRQNAAIKYQINKNCEVNIELCDMTGKKVMEVLHENQNVGDYNRSFNVSHLNPGFYFLKLSVDHYSETQKIIISK